MHNPTASTPAAPATRRLRAWRLFALAATVTALAGAAAASESQAAALSITGGDAVVEETGFPGPINDGGPGHNIGDDCFLHGTCGDLGPVDPGLIGVDEPVPGGDDGNGGDEEDEDNSGHGNGGDDEDEDNSGAGGCCTGGDDGGGGEDDD